MAEFDLLIIGSGPGGYVAAIRGAQAGLSVALVEQESLGGICLNWGCIPTKTLLRSAEIRQDMLHAVEYGIHAHEPGVDFPAVVARSREVAKANSAGVAFLMKKNKVNVLKGRAQLLAHDPAGEPRVSVSLEDGTRVVTSKSVILATGASPRSLPQYPIDGERILTYRHAMALQQLPKSILVIGSGAIGLELAWFFNALGTTVTIVESQAQLLPAEDAEVSRFLTASLTKQGIRCLAGATLLGMADCADGVFAQIADAKGLPQEVTAEKVLFAVGMTPNVSGLGLEDAGVSLDPKGFIDVDTGMRTTAAGIWAIGDCTGKQMLAHKASAEAEVAIANITGNWKHGVDYQQMPACLYCRPQVASIGLSEAKAKELGKAYSIGRYPFQANGKARATGHVEGFIKLLFDQGTGALLGAQILGGEATEMIAAIAIALKQGLTWEQFGEIPFAHPTLSEAFSDAALSSVKKAIHL